MSTTPVLQELHELENSIAESQGRLRPTFQAFLTRHAGRKGFGSFTVNEATATKVNRLAEQLGVRLLYDGQPVTVRCIRPDRYKTGIFEARTATQQPRPVYTKTFWPPLVIVPRETPPSAK